MKKMSLLFIVLILLFTACASSCKKENAESENQETGTETEGYLAYLDTLPQNTTEFTEVRAMAFETNCIPDTLDADAPEIDQALYKRDSAVEERYDIDIVYTPVTTKIAVDTMRNSVRTGDNTFNVFLYQAQELMSIAVEGCLQDLNSVSHMDLSQEWWNQSLNDNLILHNKLFCTAGQYSQWYFGAPVSIAYNYKVAADHGITNIDELVDSGKWTMAAMQEICVDQNITLDKNSDGVMDERDIYSIAVYQPVLYGLFPGVGGSFSTVNRETGEIAVNIANNISVQRLDAIIQVFNSTTTYYNDNIVNTENVFKNDGALFFYAPLGFMADLVDVTFDYGIIPTPKYNTNQKEYISCANPQSNFCLGIPFGLSKEETDFVGLMMEAYNYTSSIIVKPVKYDSFMKYRVADNPESSARLDDMFENLYFDMNLVMNFGNSRTLINTTIFNENTGRYKATVTASQPAIDEDIRKLVDVSSAET